MPVTAIQRRTGIGFADETLCDRDDRGVLWRRVPSRPGLGRPQWGQVHPLRQRRAMRRLLCQVCGGPADRNDLGTLWLVRDFRDWPDWPNRMAATEPPVCLPCAHISARACPSLRRGYAAIRVGRSEVAGIYGVRYSRGPFAPTPVEDAILTYDDPTVYWACAGQLVRTLLDCTIVNLSEEAS